MRKAWVSKPHTVLHSIGLVAAGLLTVVLVAVSRTVLRMHAVEALVAVAAGYALQHIASVLMHLTMISGLPYDRQAIYGWQGVVMILAWYAVIIGLAYWCLGRRLVIDYGKIANGGIWVAISMMILALVIVADLIVEQAPIVVQRFCYPYDLMCTVLGLVVLVLVSAKDMLAVNLAVMRQTERLHAEHYALFANMLDNAIEAVQGIEDESRRAINLTARVSGGLLMVEESNCCQEAAIRMDGGLSRSTKGDDRYHGFGMKSMERVVAAYGGEMIVDVHDGIFRLSIIWDSSVTGHDADAVAA